MKEILNVIKLDIMFIKRYFKLYLYLLVIAIVFSLASKNFILSTTTMMMLISVRGVSLIYEIQEKYNCDKFYNYLPINLKKIVIGRYASICLIGMAVLFIFLSIQTLIFVILGIPIDGNDILLSLATGVLLLCCSIMIQIPIFYRLGAISAKPFCFLPIVFYSLLVYVIKDIPWFRELNGIYSCSLICILLLLLLYVSFHAALKIYQKKEF